jgi:16S rRNA (cytidine1402-2'-O)-methyltransferase
MSDIFQDREAVIARELTKLNEEYIRGSLLELKDLDFSTLKGEMVILIHGLEKSTDDISDEVIIKRLQFCISKGATKKAAIEIVCDELKLHKNRVYKLAQNL